MARLTGLEPATSGVTGRHSNQLSYNRVARTVPVRPSDAYLEGRGRAVKHHMATGANFAPPHRRSPGPGAQYAAVPKARVGACSTVRSTGRVNQKRLPLP